MDSLLFYFMLYFILNIYLFFQLLLSSLKLNMKFILIYYVIKNYSGHIYMTI